MRRFLVIVLLPALTLAPAFGQSVDWDGRGTGTNLKLDRMERKSSSRSSSSERNDRDTESMYIPPSPPDPLPDLVGGYRSLRGWFRSDLFPDAPGLVEPSNISELYWSLSALSDYAGGKLRSLRSKAAALRSRHQELQEQLRRDSDFSAELAREIAEIESDIARSSSEAREVEGKLTAQGALLEQVTSTLRRIEEETKAKKAEVFQRLSEAQRRGVILPPSSYRKLPEPPPPGYRRWDEPRAGVVAIQPNMVAPEAIRALAPASAAPLSVRPSFPLAPLAARRGPVGEHDVRQKMAEISSTMPLINAATVALNEVYQQVVQQERLAAATSSAVGALRQQADTLHSDRESSANALNQAKGKLSDAVAAYQRQRERLPLHCLEQAFWQYSYKNMISMLEVKELASQTKELATGSAADRYVNVDIPEGVEAALPDIDIRNVRRAKRVMNHIVELGADTQKVILRVPNVFNDLERPEELHAAMKDVVNRFQLNLADELSVVPEPLKWLFNSKGTP
ncbi:MAG: hypothetical protein LC802_03115 [Acidobacteria bacterium]|nr:hypothetical protein [Acidobacteriota bacterium]